TSHAQYATGPTNIPIYRLQPLEFIAINAITTDHEMGGAVSTISWTILGEDDFVENATGTTYSSNLDPGSYTIILRPQDNFGFWGEASKVIWIMEFEQTTPGIASPTGITAQPDGSAVFVTEEINPTTWQMSRFSREPGIDEGTGGDLTLTHSEGSASLSSQLRDIKAMDNANVFSLEADGTISRFATADLASNATPVTCSVVNPTTFAYGADSFLYVTDVTAGRLYKVNPSTGAITASPTMGNIFGVAYFDSTTDMLYVTQPASSLVRKYNLSYTIQPFTGTGVTGPLYTTTSAKYVIVSNGSNSLSFFDHSTGTLQFTMDGFTTARGVVVVGPDLYVVENTPNRITRYRFGRYDASQW
ncbi:MAG TPA: hypothetical protein PKO06_05845, partial [Candidatus Ozemobacteraceae bacterium]|nr:hypothetical protein [Candidatus Ozemobacteraceae bacterium]